MENWAGCDLINNLINRKIPYTEALFKVQMASVTHWIRVTHICVRKLTTICSDNGLSTGRCQAIIWTSARILLIGTLGTNFSEILLEIFKFSFNKMCLKLSSENLRQFCFGPNAIIFGLNVSEALLCKHNSLGYSVWLICVTNVQTISFVSLSIFNLSVLHKCHWMLFQWTFVMINRGERIFWLIRNIAHAIIGTITTDLR